MEFFDGRIESYFVAVIIGALCCLLMVFVAFGLACLVDKIRNYADYCKKRKKVIEMLYPQYVELMKGEENHD